MSASTSGGAAAADMLASQPQSKPAEPPASMPSTPPVAAAITGTTGTSEEAQLEGGRDETLSVRAPEPHGSIHASTNQGVGDSSTCEPEEANAWLRNAVDNGECTAQAANVAAVFARAVAHASGTTGTTGATASTTGASEDDAPESPPAAGLDDDEVNEALCSVGRTER